MPQRVFIYVVHTESACSIVVADDSSYFVSSASHPEITFNACDDRLITIRSYVGFLTKLVRTALQVAPCYPWRIFDPMICL